MTTFTTWMLLMVLSTEENGTMVDHYPTEAACKQAMYAIETQPEKDPNLKYGLDYHYECVEATVVRPEGEH